MMNPFLFKALKKSFFILLIFLSTTGFYGQAQLSPVVITEFLASNDGVLLDKDGDASDWIEIFNRSEEVVSLEGWCLTDDISNLSKWVFPNLSLLPGEFKVIFASGKDVNLPSQELHTNFKLSAKGEYLALIENDQITVASEFSPEYKEQLENMSYGLVQNAISNTYVNKNTSAKLLVPLNNTLGLTWTGLPINEPFSDDNWKSVTSAIGYAKTLPVVDEENIALLGVAAQSSTYDGYPASLANDDIGDNFAHTANSDTSPWLEIDFGVAKTIGEVVLYNRVNCCQDRFYNLTVTIYNEQDNVVYTSEMLNAYQEGETPESPGSSIRLNILESLPYGVVGSRVRVTKTAISNAREYLQVAEIQIFGTKETGNQNITANIETDLYTVNSSTYTRYPFFVNQDDLFNSISFKMKYDDGFIAYLNGVQIASKNAPLENPEFNDTANSTYVTEEFELNAIDPNLLKKGENILAIQGFNVSKDDLTYYIEPQLEALQIETTNNDVYFATPTPGAYNNSEGFLDLIGGNELNFKRGFYKEPIEVVVSNNAPGVDIVYTTDGSEPSKENGTIIQALSPTSAASATISINKTTVLRTLAIKESYKASDVDTNTYIFLEDVINSEVMDTDITKDPAYESLMEKALTDLPTISIVTDINIINKETDVFASMEMIFPNGESGFQENAGVINYGGYYTTFDKLNFRLYFKSKYGASKLEFPLFKGHAHGIEPVSVFDQIELRAGSHDMNMRGFYMSNRFTDDTMLEMGNLNPHGQFVHMYLNGVYWGQYHLRERWNADMHAQYLGGDKEDYEAINGNKNLGGWAPNDTPYDGDGTAWERVESLRDNFAEVSPYLDVAQYIDFMLLYMFGNSESEYRTVGSIEAGTGFKFYLNDADGFLRDSGNRTDMGQPGQKSADGPASIFSMLLKEASPKFKTLLADRIHKHFFNDGVLTPEKIEERLLARCNQVSTSIIAESARWGYRTPESWESSVNSYLSDVAPYRTNTVINQFINAGFYPSIEAPILKINNTEHYGGDVEVKDLLSIAANYGDVYYTLNGTDPYMPSDYKNDKDLVTLINQDTPKTVFVPTENLPLGWNSNVDFDDAKWISGTGTFGYEIDETGNDVDIDLENEMYNKQFGALARIKFNINNINNIKQLLLYLSYDDAVVVYLNGQQVMSLNAPSGTLLYNSKALSSSEASSLATFNISEYLNYLKTGTNVLAIHGLNLSLSSTDFYVSAELFADISHETENVISPDAIKYSGESIELNETTHVKARAVSNDQWSALSDANYAIENLSIDGVESFKSKTYPNPFSDGFNMDFNSPVGTVVNLKIYDISGSVVLNKEYTVRSDGGNSVYVDSTLWEGGLYIYKMILSSGETTIGKLICKK